MWARLWAGMLQRYADYQRRGVAAAMYAVLSKLTDEELANRGIAHAHLARSCGLKSYSPDVSASSGPKSAAHGRLHDMPAHNLVG
jgi:hypothetical protein